MAPNGGIKITQQRRAITLNQHPTVHDDTVLISLSKCTSREIMSATSFIFIICHLRQQSIVLDE
jgi:hypothetical protein